jgi:hypothetical protein
MCGIGGKGEMGVNMQHSFDKKLDGAIRFQYLRQIGRLVVEVEAICLTNNGTTR